MTRDASPRSAAATTLASLNYLHSADISPDGSQVAWASSRIEADTEFVELRLTQVGESTSTPLVMGGYASSPEWSPSGQHIAFIGAGAEGVQVGLVNASTGERSALTSLPQGIAGRPRWSPDGTKIAFSARNPTPDRSVPYRVTRAVGWLDGAGLAEDAKTDLYVVDVATLELTRLTQDEWSNGSPEWYPGSDRLAYLAGSSPDDWRRESRVRTVDLSGNITEIAALGDAFSIGIHEGDLFFTSFGGGTSRGPANGGVNRLETDGRILERTSALDIDVNGDVIGDQPVPFADPLPRLLFHDGDAIVRVQFGERLEAHRVALQGEQASVAVLSFDDCVYPLSVQNGLLLYGRGDRLTPPDLWVRELATGVDTRITDTASENRAKLTPVRVVPLDVRTEGGPQVPTNFWMPEGATLPLPTVLLMHGGPAAAYGEAFFADAQLLCEAGFGVLMVDARGSRGYGEEFLTANYGDFGGVDVEDFHAAVDRAVEMGLADPTRLGAAGLSYGAYMTTMLIGLSDRFAAAVAENPVTNFLSLYGTSDVGLRWVPSIMGGPIESTVEQVLKSSPISRAEQVTTPTLLIVSEEDRRCPPEQALQFYSRLRSTGCTAELVMMPGASHDSSVHGAPILRRTQNHALVDWMTTHLLQQTEESN